MIPIDSAKIFNISKEKWSHAGFQRYFRNTGWVFAGQSVTVVSFLVNIWVVRHLGPTNFGSLSYIFTFTGLFAFISNLGIQDVLIRDLVKYPDQTQKITSTAVRMILVSGMIAFLAASIGSFITNGATLITLLTTLYATIFFWSPMLVINSYFQATVQAKQNALIQISGTVVASVFKIYLILTGKGIIWLTGAFALDYAIGGLFYIWAYKRLKLDFIRFNVFDWPFAKNLFQASWLLMIAAAFSYTLFKIDQILIKNLLDETSLGLYAAATKLSEIWYLVPASIVASIFPAIINAKIVQKETYRERLKKLVAFLVVISATIAVFISVFASWIIPVLFGAQYTKAIPIAQIYIWSNIGFFLIIVTTKYLITENRFAEIAIYSGLAAAINIGLNLLFIQTIGPAGAALASVISYAVIPLLALTKQNCIIKYRQ